MSDNTEQSAENEAWWPEFVSLYKQVPLRELARRFNTNPRRLRRAAQRSGLEDEPDVIRENLARLGTVPDPTLADHLGVTPEIIKGARARRNIPAYDPSAPKPKTGRRSSKRAPPPRPVKPPRIRPDPMLVEVVRRGASPIERPRDAEPPPQAPRPEPRPIAPPRPEFREPERRWRSEERPWSRDDTRPEEGEERRRRIVGARGDDNAFGERRRIIQTSPRSGEAVVRRVAEVPRTGARAPSTPAAPAAHRSDEDFEEYARRRIRESGRRLAETIEAIEAEAPEGPRPRRRIVSADRLEELRDGHETAAKTPAREEHEPPPARVKRARPAPPLPVRTLFDKDLDEAPPAELLRDLPLPPELPHSEHTVAPRPAVIPPQVPVMIPPPPQPAPPVRPLRFWQAMMEDGALRIIAAADIADAARLIQPFGAVRRLEPAALLD